MMTNSLNPQELDVMRFDMNQSMDNRKPFRQFVDDKLVPNIGMVAAAPVAAASALGHIQRTPKLINVQND